MDPREILALCGLDVNTEYTMDMSDDGELCLDCPHHIISLRDDTIVVFDKDTLMTRYVRTPHENPYEKPEPVDNRALIKYYSLRNKILTVLLIMTIVFAVGIVVGLVMILAGGPQEIIRLLQYCR